MEEENGLEALSERLELITSFQMALAQHSRKIIRDISTPLALESLDDESLNHRTLLNTIESIYKFKYLERKKTREREYLPVMDLIEQDKRSESRMSKHAKSIFQSEFENKILTKKESNQSIRKRENLVEKQRRIEQYERQNQQSKWSTLYRNGDPHKERAFLELENVEKDISALVARYNTIYHHRKPKGKFMWNGVAKTSELEDAYLDNYEIPEKPTKPSGDASILGLLHDGNDLFTFPSALEKSNVMEEQNLKVDNLIHQTCLHLSLLKPLQRINTDTQVNDEEYGSVFIKLVPQESEPIRFKPKVDQVREYVLGEHNSTTMTEEIT